MLHILAKYIVVYLYFILILLWLTSDSYSYAACCLTRENAVLCDLLVLPYIVTMVLYFHGNVLQCYYIVPSWAEVLTCVNFSL